MENKAISIKLRILKNIRNKRYYKKKDIRWGEKKERESENIKKKEIETKIPYSDKGLKNVKERQ